jgi:hypothetical protein
MADSLAAGDQGLAQVGNWQSLTGRAVRGESVVGNGVQQVALGAGDRVPPISGLTGCAG